MASFIVNNDEETNNNKKKNQKTMETENESETKRLWYQINDFFTRRDELLEEQNRHLKTLISLLSKGAPIPYPIASVTIPSEEEPPPPATPPETPQFGEKPVFSPSDPQLHPKPIEIPGAEYRPPDIPSVILPPVKPIIPGVAESTAEKLDRVNSLLSEIVRLEREDYPFPIGPRPEIDIWNMGNYVIGRVLPPGVWTTIWEADRAMCPINIYWKVIVCDTPNFDCLCLQDTIPVCASGCNFAALWTLGITRFNDRGWVSLYNTVDSLYGLECNIIRPVRRNFVFQIKNSDPVPRNAIVVYTKWYQWQRPA